MAGDLFGHAVRMLVTHHYMADARRYEPRPTPPLAPVKWLNVRLDFWDDGQAIFEIALAERRLDTRTVQEKRNERRK
jgi:hypothetical protein